MRFAGDEGVVARIGVAEQQAGAIGVGAGDQDGGHAADIGGEARGDELFDEFARGNNYFAAEVSAFFGGGELIFEVDAGGAGFDHATS